MIRDRPRRYWWWHRWLVRISWVFLASLTTIIFFNSIPARVPIGVGILCLVAGYFAGIAIHELGHAVAAILVRWRVLAIAIWPLAYHLPTRRIVRMRFGGKRELGGYVLAFPRLAETETPLHAAIVSLGGPIANIIAGIVAVRVGVLAASANGGEIAGFALVAFVFALLSLFLGLGALIPARFGDHTSDGWDLLNLFRLGRRGMPSARQWLIELHQQAVRLADYPQWLIDRAMTDAAGDSEWEVWLSAFNIGCALDRFPVDVASARTMIDTYGECYGVTEWQSYWDVYLAAVWEHDGLRAANLLWEGEQEEYLAPLRLAAEASIAARLGDAEAMRTHLDAMDVAVAKDSSFTDLTYRDIRRRIEAIA